MNIHIHIRRGLHIHIRIHKHIRIRLYKRTHIRHAITRGFYPREGRYAVVVVVETTIP